MPKWQKIRSASWAKELLMTFAGATLSIILTFGTAHFIEEKEKREALPTVADLITPEAKLAYATSKALPYEKAAELFDFKSRGMEDALVKRLENWMVNLNTNAEEVSYPQWWVDERKKENAIIDAWNKKQAEPWIASFAEYDAKMQAFAQRLVQLDNQLEQTRANGEKTLNYYMGKQQVYMVQMYFIDFYSACSNALNFPHVEHLEESGSYSPGMGGKG